MLDQRTEQKNDKPANSGGFCISAHEPSLHGVSFQEDSVQAFNDLGDGAKQTLQRHWFPVRPRTPSPSPAQTPREIMPLFTAIAPASDRRRQKAASTPKEHLRAPPARTPQRKALLSTVRSAKTC